MLLVVKDIFPKEDQFLPASPTEATGRFPDGLGLVLEVFTAAEHRKQQHLTEQGLCAPHSAPLCEQVQEHTLPEPPEGGRGRLLHISRLPQCDQ